jgi:molybdopterin molybdotransferase
MPKTYIGFGEAFDLALENVRPLAPEWRRLSDGLDTVAAEEMQARVDAPSASSSLKDGYAVRSEDLAGASLQTPVKLSLRGVAAAGDLDLRRVYPYSAVRILTGGRIPLGADAVVAEEFSLREIGGIVVDQAIEAGRNILRQGEDVRAGETLARAGECLTPGRLGLLAAAGHSYVTVHPRPRVAVIATGDEIRLPGAPLEPGQLYASNAVTLEAWCRRFKCETILMVVPDRPAAILEALREAVETSDVVLTSGGAWSGERDLVRLALEDLGWQMVFHRIRLGPGKATGMGWVGRCPVFMLPGGPPSNLVGFLKLALPAILKMSGHLEGGLPRQRVRLKSDARGPSDWTQAVFGGIQTDGEGRRLFEPDRQASRLKAMGYARALLTIPEGVDRMPAGSAVHVEMLS